MASKNKFITKRQELRFAKSSRLFIYDYHISQGKTALIFERKPFFNPDFFISSTLRGMIEGFAAGLIRRFEINHLS